MPNDMNIIAPPVGTAGPDWAEDINTILETTIANHNHEGPNGGSTLTQDAINIDAAFNFNGQPITALAYAQLASTGSNPTLTGTIYNLGGNLYYKNTLGNAIQITDNTGLAAISVGGITGLASSNGSADYNVTSANEFTFKTTNGTQYALINAGGIELFNYTQINPTFKTAIVQPNVLTANKVFQLGTTNIYFPSSLPASVPATLQITAGGAIEQFIPVEDSATGISQALASLPTTISSLSLTPTGRTIQFSLQPSTGVASNLYLEAVASGVGGSPDDPCIVYLYAIINGNSSKQGKLRFKLYDPVSFGTAGGGAEVNPSFTWNYTPTAGEIGIPMSIELVGYKVSSVPRDVTLRNWSFVARELD